MQRHLLSLSNIICVIFLMCSISHATFNCYDVFKPYSSRSLIDVSKRATSLKKQGRLHEAISQFEIVLKMDSNNAIALSQSGYLYLMTGQYALARKRLDHAQKVEPHNRQVFWNRLQVRIAQKDAIAVEQMVRKMGTSNLRTYGEAALLLMEKKYKAAVYILDQAPETPAFLRLRAQAYYSMGMFDKASKYLLLAIKKTNGHDYSAVAALIKIDKGETPTPKYLPSEQIAEIIKGYNLFELTRLIEDKTSDEWFYHPQPHKSDHSKIFNNFWADEGYTVPVDSAAVKEIRARRDHN